MSSHREAPAISKDPVADNTDLYAWVAADAPDHVTILANYIPFEKPEGGPNFFAFGDDVLYEIKIDNNQDAREDIIYQFRFKTIVTNQNTFLYNTGPIGSLTDPNWNVRQLYRLTRIRRGSSPDTIVLGKNLRTPPVNIGPRSTPDYAALADAAIIGLDGDGDGMSDMKVFAGQREDGFNVDLGSIFDLGALRPFQDLHLIGMPAAAGKDGTKGFNVHTIALQIPKSQLTSDGSMPTDPMAPESVIGIWATASRQKATVRNDDEDDPAPENQSAGPWVQVSRLGNPLINEVVIPLSRKDVWNSRRPRRDSVFRKYYTRPELQALLPILYPGVFPNLATNPPRPDLVAILLTGIPAGIIGGFQNFTGPTQADMLRLNMAIPPSAAPSEFGILGGDLAGFPNGRRLADNVAAIELRAIAGVTLPLVDPSYTPDAAAGLLLDGTSNEVASLPEFPYLGHPHQGFEHVHD